MSDRKGQTDNLVSEHAGEIQQNSQIHDFLENFQFSLATSPDEKRRAFALRHEVFREELHYKLGENLSSPYENDRHDHHSILCLLTHKSSGIDAGCVRVVLTQSDDDVSPILLPLEESCGNSLHHPQLHPKNFSRNSICEVSRLAVRSCFRRIKHETSGLDDQNTQTISHNEKHQPSLLIGISLFLAATALVGLSGKQHVFAMMEPRFARLLKVSGLRFQQVGEMIDYHGPRAAFYIDQKKAENQLRSDLSSFYAYIKRELSKHIDDTLSPNPLLLPS